MIATSMAAPGIPATETGEPIAPDGKLTVIMPTYNHGHFIAQALDSVFRQTRRPDRVIVLDDGSTDDTAAVVKPYLGRVPPVEYIRMAQNRGVIEVMNVGLGMVETDFVTFLAADDMLELSAYEKTLCTLERYPQAAICGVLTQLIDEDGCPLARRHDFDFGTGARYLSSQECLARLNRYGGLFGGVGAVFRSWSLKRAGGFAHDLLAFCDGFRYQELALTYGVCIVPEKLALWRQSRGSYAATSTLDPERSIAILQAVRMRLAQPSSPFPAAYGRRLVRRLRFAAARAACRSATRTRSPCGCESATFTKPMRMR
jgi:glycosyltransferase involved in cell wall biosynthesis